MKILKNIAIGIAVVLVLAAVGIFGLMAISCGYSAGQCPLDQVFSSPSGK